MKNLIILLTVVLLGVGANAQSIEERVDAIEMNQLLNSMQFNGSLWMDYNALESDPDDGSDKSNLSISRLRFALDFANKLSNRFSFYGRFTTTKLWNEFYSDNVGSAPSNVPVSDQDDLADADRYEGAEVYLERAYANVSLSDTVTLSFGRLSTVDGPPTQFYDNVPRQGTYPKMAFAAILDGIALTHSLKLSNTRSLSTRVLYTPISHVDRPATGGIAGYGKISRSASSNISEMAPTGTIMFDYVDNAPGWADKMNAVFQYVTVNDFDINDVTIDGSSVFTSDNKIEYQYMTAYFDALNVANSKIDVALSVLNTTIKSKGLISSAFGFLTNDANDTVNGMGILLNLNYNLNWGDNFGLEYMTASEGYFYNAATTEDIIGIYRNPGDSYHIYYTHKIGDYTRLRVGMMSRTQKYGGDGVGGAVSDLVGSEFFSKRQELTNQPTVSATYIRLRSDF